MIPLKQGHVVHLVLLLLVLCFCFFVLLCFFPVDYCGYWFFFCLKSQNFIVSWLWRVSIWIKVSLRPCLSEPRKWESFSDFNSFWCLILCHTSACGAITAICASGWQKYPALVCLSAHSVSILSFWVRVPLNDVILITSSRIHYGKALFTDIGIKIIYHLRHTIKSWTV